MIFLAAALGCTCRTLWNREPAGSRWLYVAGLLLIASGLLHLPVWFVDGGVWSGPVSWRKPILFGVSTGVTLLSLGWVIGVVFASRSIWHDCVAQLVAVAGVIEVGLITLQSWRGVPSHFNSTTPFDSAIHYSIDALVCFIMLAVLYLTAASLARPGRNHPPLAADERLGLRFGMIALSLSCLFGLWMLLYGIPRADAGQDPGQYGEAGVLKFIHGMPIHALQVLPITSWLLVRLSVNTRQRLVVTWCQVAGVILTTLYASLQTFRGLPRFETEAASMAVLALGVLLLLAPLPAVIRQVLSRLMG